MEWKYTNRINKLEKENNLIRDFERENNIMLDAEKQIKNEERRNQILLLIGFFIVLFIIGGIGEFIRHKPIKRNNIV